MIVMPGNNSMALSLGYSQLGMLVSPGGWWHGAVNCPSGYGIDNGIYGLWRKGEQFHAKPFINLLDTVYKQSRKPRWVLPPDAVADKNLTDIRWRYWHQIIKYDFGFTLAFAVQDGHTVEDIPKSAEVAFLAGSTQWKRQNIKYFCSNYPRVHIARINTLRWLWVCHNAGAESIDGTGWFRHPFKIQELKNYLDVSSGRKDKLEFELFNTGEFAGYEIC